MVLISTVHHSCNVFDEFFYTYTNPNSVDTDFRNIPSLRNNVFQVPKDLIGSERGYGLYLTYDKQLEGASYLRDNTSAYAELDPERKTVEWICTVNYSKEEMDTEYGNSEELVIRYLYEVKNRYLTISVPWVRSEILYEELPEKDKNRDTDKSTEFITDFCRLHGITDKTIDAYISYFLDDVIIGLWIEGNGNASRYTADDPG